MSQNDDASDDRGRSFDGRGHSPDDRYGGNRGGASQARLNYEPQTPLYSRGALQPPDSSLDRPRSMPPPGGRYNDNDDFEEDNRRDRDVRRRRSNRDRDGDRDRDDDRDRDRDRDRDHDRDRTPIGRAKHAIENAFTDSTTGLGVGVLGALVGGLAAHEVSEHATRHNTHGRPSDSQKRAQLLSTVVGAAVGALGANAVEKRIEVNREREQREQDRWEDKYRPNSRGSLGGRADVIDRREIVRVPATRGSSGPRDEWRRERQYDTMERGGVSREVDPDARSWRNVEDWVYDERDPRRGRRSDDQPRYRW